MLLICSTRVRVRREHLECTQQRARGIERPNQIINPVDNRLLTIDLLLEAFNNPESESMIGSLLNRRSFLLTLDIAVQSSSLQLDCCLSTTAHVCGDQDESGLRRVSPPS